MIAMKAIILHTVGVQVDPTPEAPDVNRGLALPIQNHTGSLQTCLALSLVYNKSIRGLQRVFLRNSIGLGIFKTQSCLDFLKLKTLTKGTRKGAASC